MWSSFTTKNDKKGKKSKAVVEEPVKVSSPASSYRKSNFNSSNRSKKRRRNQNSRQIICGAPLRPKKTRKARRAKL
jgi:hypothetical protein